MRGRGEGGHPCRRTSYRSDCRRAGRRKVVVESTERKGWSQETLIKRIAKGEDLKLGDSRLENGDGRGGFTRLSEYWIEDLSH